MNILIVSIIFILSFGGIVFILYRRIPDLCELPINGKMEFIRPKFILEFENRIQKFFSIFQKHILLHKILFFVKCIISKIEHKIDNYLHHIRRKAQQKSNDKK